MTKVHKSLVVPFSVDQMYDLINEIEDYPKFLPWCSGAEVHSRSDTEVKATIHLAKGPITYSITTVNQMQPKQLISMQYLAGPFRHCAGSWEFTAIDKPEHSQVAFSMDYQFSNRLAALAIEPVFKPIMDTLIDAFYARAEHIYGG